FLSHLEHTSLEPFLNLVFEYARQFISQPEPLRVSQSSGPKYQAMLPEILKSAKCCFRIDGSSGQVFKEQELQALMMFLRAAESSSAIRGQVDLLTLYRKIYRRLGFMDEAEIFRSMSETLPTEEPADEST